MLNRKIIPSITTQSRGGHTWRQKIEEIIPLQVSEVGLFLTGLDSDERAECYELLEEVSRKHSFRIPFVHAVSEMREEEYWHLTRVFSTEKFNLHPVHEYPLEHPLSPEIRSRIFIENTSRVRPLSVEDLKGFAGICFDLSHLEESRRTSIPQYYHLLSLTKFARLGANHISAMTEKPHSFGDGLPQFSSHNLDESSSVRYISSLQPTAFAPLCAVELENSLEEQLVAIPMIQRAMIRSCANAWLEEAA